MYLALIAGSRQRVAHFPNFRHCNSYVYPNSGPVHDVLENLQPTRGLFFCSAQEYLVDDLIGTLCTGSEELLKIKFGVCDYGSSWDCAEMRS
jgi:hypothetical protein